MKRMQLRHHKIVLTITTLVLVVIGVVIGISIDQAYSGSHALAIVNFAYLLLLVALTFILLSVTLRTRDELHELHADITHSVSAAMPPMSVKTAAPAPRRAVGKKR